MRKITYEIIDNNDKEIELSLKIEPYSPQDFLTVYEKLKHIIDDLQDF